MFLFETFDNLLIPCRADSLHKLRQPPYDTMAGMDGWLKKAESALTVMKILAWVFFVFGIFTVIFGFGLVLIWFAMYIFHYTRVVKKEALEVMKIRHEEILNLQPQGRILEHY